MIQDKRDFIKLRLSLTKKQARDLTRVKRWEDRSASVCIELGPRK